MVRNSEFNDSLWFGFLVCVLWSGLRFVKVSNAILIDDDAWKWFIVINFFTLIVNLADKMLALCNCCCRVPEIVLHLLSLAGGAPSTALSMMLFNHKSSKISYNEGFKKCCIMHIIVFISLCISKK